LFRFAVPVFAVALLAAQAVQAQEFVRDDCRGVVAPSAAQKYDTPEHARWYKRFWTGDCDHLMFCFPGSPNWNDIVGKLLVKGGPSQSRSPAAQGLSPGSADRSGMVARQEDQAHHHGRPARVRHHAGGVRRCLARRGPGRRQGASDDDSALT
jgi:hypothetical protein